MPNSLHLTFRWEYSESKNAANMKNETSKKMSHTENAEPASWRLIANFSWNGINVGRRTAINITTRAATRVLLERRYLRNKKSDAAHVPKKEEMPKSISLENAAWKSPAIMFRKKTRSVPICAMMLIKNEKKKAAIHAASCRSTLNSL